MNTDNEIEAACAPLHAEIARLTDLLRGRTIEVKDDPRVAERDAELREWLTAARAFHQRHYEKGNRECNLFCLLLWRTESLLEGPKS